jgi:hypothetical protein
MTTTVRWVAGITAAIVLVQAALIGQALFFGEASPLALHGWLGNVSFVGAIALVGLLFSARRRGELPGFAFGLAVVVAVLMVVQIGLGYSGRAGGWPTALPVPNGVLVAGLLAALLTVSLVTPRDEPRRS